MKHKMHLMKIILGFLLISSVFCYYRLYIGQNDDSLFIFGLESKYANTVGVLVETSYKYLDNLQTVKYVATLENDQFKYEHSSSHVIDKFNRTWNTRDQISYIWRWY